MKRSIISGVKLLLFVLMTFICVFFVNHLLEPKYYYNEQWPATNTFLDFYELKKDTVDVLFMGSSHAAASFNPQVIYDTYGIRSYNLASEQQSVFVTYYWLKEALKYQSPKVLVLDAFTFHKYSDAYVYNDLNCSESAVRKAMDNMRLSPLKIEAARVIEEIDPTQSGLSYIFTNIRYHDRWKKLGEKDYTKREMISHGAIKGYAPQKGVNEGDNDYTIYADGLDDIEAEPFATITTEYIDKIKDLCEEEQINLILVNIPWGEPADRYKTIKKYADSCDIPYYDFNEDSLYREIGYSSKLYGYGHPNDKGAQVLSLYIGKQLLETYGVESAEDPSFDKSRKNYEHVIHNYELKETTDAYEYLSMINNDSYDVFVFAPFGIDPFDDGEINRLWHNLGFKADLGNIPEYHYIAVKSDGIIEKPSYEDLSFSGNVRNGRVIYSFCIDTEVMLEEYRTYSMCVNEKEYSVKDQGITMVIYDNDYKKIVDHVNLDTGKMIVTRD